MKNYTLIAIISLSVFFGCKNTEKNNSEIPTKGDSLSVTENIEAGIDENVAPLQKYFYKYFAGKIEKTEIRMSLNRTEDRIWGYYYYKNIGRQITLSGEIDSLNNIKLEEYVNGNVTGTFVGKMSEKGFSGEWKNEDKKMEFTLVENYSNSVKMSAFYHKEVYHMYGNEEYPSFTIEDKSLYADGNKKFSDQKINDLLINNYVSDSLRGKTETETFANIVQAYINDYKDVSEDSDFSEEEVLEDGWMFNWDNSSSWYVVMNDKNFLTVEKYFYEYSGGAHGYGGLSFSCIDLTNYSILDIWQVVDKTKSDEIVELILAEIEEQGRLEDLFSIEEVYVSENFYIDLSGIGFVYNQYEIAPYAAGAFDIYFEFKELDEFLTESFKKRIK